MNAQELISRLVALGGSAHKPDCYYRRHVGGECTCGLAALLSTAVDQDTSPRAAVYAAIDTERNYQDSRWNSETTTSGGLHSLEEWLVYIRSYLRTAEDQLARNPKQIGDPAALETIRKITAMGVACMEQHGAPRRETP